MLTTGGEPTFNARDGVDLPEWNGAALGPKKWEMGLVLAAELRKRVVPGGVMLHRIGKWYPGESLPRWALDLIGRRDGVALWKDWAGPEHAATAEDAERFAQALAKKLGVPDGLHAAYEDPWELLKEETRIPVELDSEKASLDDPEVRRRIARLLSQGVNTIAGWVLPLMPEPTSTAWQSSKWAFRRSALDDWLRAIAATPFEPASLHGLLTHVVDESAAIFEAIGRELLGYTPAPQRAGDVES